jgi:hypothetical protein
MDHDIILAPFKRLYETFKEKTSNQLSITLGINESTIENFSKTGLPSLGPTVNTTLDSCDDWKKEYVDNYRSNSVFLDTTTLASMYEVVEGEKRLHAMNLWDLSTFVDSVILFDHIFYLKNSKLNEIVCAKDLNAKLSDEVIIELDYHQSKNDYSIIELIQKKWDGAESYLSQLNKLDSIESKKNYPEERKMYIDAWSEFFGISEKDFFLFDQEHRDFYSSDISNVEAFYDSIHETEKIQISELEGPVNWTRIISECNLREEFNTSFCYFLDIPYFPNGLRCPARKARYSRAKKFPSFLASKYKFDEIYYSQSEIYRLKNDSYLTLPIFLSAVIEKIDDLSEFWERIADIRGEAKNFRKKRGDLDNACKAGNINEIKKLKNAVVQESKEFAKWAEISITSTAGIGSTLLIAICPRIGVATIPVQLAIAALSPWIKNCAQEVIRNVVQRLFAPTNYFLNDIGDRAGKITNSLDKVEKLWGTELDDKFGLQLLERLKSWKMI